jgi:hypothetical protein
MAAPRTRPKAQSLEHALAPEDERRVREGIAASERSDGIDLTAEEVDAWAEEGVLPDRAERWFARRGF